MKKYFLLFLLFILVNNSANAADDFYSLSAVKINGDTLNFSELKGKKLLIVNTASLCGYTYQYEELQTLYELYGGENFEIIGFPANNFSNQEPGSNEDIEDFCKENYGVTFTMMQKISVLDPGMHTVYKWLTQKSLNGVQDSKVQWNFQKYLINADGTYYKVIGTQTSPLAATIKNWLDEPLSVLTPKPNDNIKINLIGNTLSIQPPTYIENITNIEIYNIHSSRVHFTDNIENTSNEIILQLSTLNSGKYFVVLTTLEQAFYGSFTFVK